MVGEGPTAEDQLRNLRSITDAALGRLGLEDLLNELLDRVRTILHADTAAVLLVDEVSGHLVARAACGIEEEVRLGVHIPIGRGFAGRIASTKRPVTLDRVDSTTVANPILWKRGIQTMLGVPLFSGDTVLGVLHVGRVTNKPFCESDVELLEIVADRLAPAVQGHQFALEKAAAALLERSLLPGRLPVCPGLEFATRYLTPSDPVGGDWYDVFTLPSGELWVVTGDVAGHGVNAAVIMGRVRSALRAYALLGVGPAKVLELTSRKVSHFEMDTLVTAVCATTVPPFSTIRVATAGHPPPIFAYQDGTAVIGEVPVGPPLGTDDVCRYVSTTDFPAGAVMLVYTDGLIERRGEDVGIGLERLRHAVQAEDPESLCQNVSTVMLGNTELRDDVAMVAVRRTDHLAGSH
jgi:hypothetical protein